ncbi:hypothetical protein PWEIH_14676 [Listeria weihenstephanensis FSL R9-0317]|uniref:Cytoplasmic protein n=1 Tax=Listeria weihenstephanensis TaxID=1006155 RepID=A0A1S7FVF8_9LIST|nr:hypothetical protein [Listeria weihenstephanensis]AQY51444.1 hypothetical protein UE46_10610 [Listeria weihenstephanensis]EUJ35797.1 hypothetical protein PWEIH_14676 [Listeria weihenstephanensis FSL R9-0317]
MKMIDDYCIGNKLLLATSKRCGCFHCLQIFDPREITMWLDAEDTAICPFCSIDAVLPELDELPISVDFLTELHQEWFE